MEFKKTANYDLAVTWIKVNFENLQASSLNEIKICN